jgi:hypothetical protein
VAPGLYRRGVFGVGFYTGKISNKEGVRPEDDTLMT